MYNKYFIFNLIFVGIITTFRLIYSNFVNLAPDEAYYWDWTRYVDWSYFDHPPMNSYLIYLSTKLFGATEFGVRFPVILISFLSSLLIYIIAKKVFSNDKVALISVILFNILPVFAVGSMIATPDTPMMLFWLLTIFFILNLMETGNKNYWYLIGLFIGFGLVSKYAMVLFIISGILFLIISRNQRKWLFTKEFYLSGIIAMIIFSPVIFWNFQHDWVSFKFQFAHGLAIKNFQPLKNLGLYLVGQLLIISPLILLGMICSLFWCWNKWFKEKNEKLLFFLLLTIVPITFFALTSLRAKVEANWPAVGYLSGIIILMGWYFEYVEQPFIGRFLAISKASLYKIFFQGIVALTIISVIFFTTILHFPGIVYSLGIKIQHEPTDKLYGWKELATEINRIYQEMKQKNDTYLISNRYQIAAETAFYVPGQPKVICVDIGARPTAYQFFFKNDLPIGSDAILIDGPIGLIGEHYQSWKELPRKEIYRYGILKHRYNIHQLSGYKGGLIGNHTISRE